jgi:hypothetical protein
MDSANAKREFKKTQAFASLQQISLNHQAEKA